MASILWRPNRVSHEGVFFSLRQKELFGMRGPLVLKVTVADYELIESLKLGIFLIDRVPEIDERHKAKSDYSDLDDSNESREATPQHLSFNNVFDRYTSQKVAREESRGVDNDNRRPDFDPLASR
jgi:hypothetical protein